MAKVKYSAGWRGLKNDLRDRPAVIQRRSAEIVNRAAERGADLMQKFIVHEGRVDTTKMYRAVSYTTPKSSYFYARFGWGLNGNPYEDYFWYQEHGFNHVGAGRYIEGMHAMLQAFVIVREQFYADVKKVTR